MDMSGKGTKMKNQIEKRKTLVLFLTVAVVALATVLIIGTVSWSASYRDSTVPPTMFVPVDVEPGYCPNPFKVYGGGEVTVAILGTDRLDVNDIAIDSIRLREVLPVRSEKKDVATPYRFYRWWITGDEEIKADYCTDQGPDGRLDLVLYFDKEDILKAVGSTRSGDLLVLKVIARDKSGAPLMGQDVAVIEQ